VLFSQITSWHQDYSPDTGMAFRNGQIMLTQYGDPPITVAAAVTSDMQHNLEFVSFEFPARESDDFPQSFFGGPKRWLILYSEGFMFAFDSENQEAIDAGFVGPNVYGILE